MKKKVFSSKKRLLIIVGIIVLLVFISIRSGIMKVKFTVSKNDSSKQQSGQLQSGSSSSSKQSDQIKIPAFTLTPPANWQKMSPNTSKGEVARYESNQIDSEKAGDGSVTTNAVISVKMAGSYKDLNDFVNQYKASGASTKGYQVIDSSALGENGYRLEMKYQTKVGEGNITVHELNYLFFKDGVSLLVRGYSSDSSWSNHVTEITTSLDSFKLK